MASRDGTILRCPDLDGTLSSIAELFAVAPARLARALPQAAAAVEADPDAEVARAIVPALTEILGRHPAAPRRIHFFHGSRAFDPERFSERGLLPLCSILDDLWERMRGLAPELSARDFAALRAGLDAGRIEALTYKGRIDARDDGPFGVLVRDVLVNATAYGSSGFVRIPEIVEDICVAARDEFDVDLEPRFERAAVPCIVVFAAPPRGFERALTTACWYAEAAQRGERAGGNDPFWDFDGDGVAVPHEDIVAVEVLPGAA